MKLKIPKGGIKTGTWNHRVIRHGSGDDTYFVVHEVHYDARGVSRGWTQEGVVACGDTLVELRETLGRMQRATEAPLLIEGKLRGRSVLLDEATGTRACNVALAGLSAGAVSELKAITKMVTDFVKEG